MKIPLLDKEMAVLSGGAYTGIFESKYNKTISFDNKETSTQAYLVFSDSLKIAVLTFRGTEKNHKDILTDIDFAKVDYKGERIHGGFLKSYLSVRKRIDNAINLIPLDYHFYVTGHSLGGALACLQALYGSRKPEKIITFGQPRIGDEKLSNKLSKLNYIRYVNHADVVPRLPKVNCYHGKHLIYLSAKGKKMLDVGFWYMFFDRSLSLRDRFTDHRINDYIKGVST